MFGGADVDKLAVFIDGGYIEKILQNEFGGMFVDYSTLSRGIASSIGSELELFRIYFYHCLPYKGNPPSEEDSRRFANRERFFNALRGKPRFEVRLDVLRRTGPAPDGTYDYEQKMVDALLSIDLVRLSARQIISHAAIVAGDGDFVPAVKAAREEGVLIWLFHGCTRHADERRKLQLSFLESCRK